MGGCLACCWGHVYVFWCFCLLSSSTMSFTRLWPDFVFSTDHQRIFINGTSYQYEVFTRYRLDWPIRLSKSNMSHMFTNLGIRGNKPNLRFLPNRFVQLEGVAEGLVELGISGPPVRYHRNRLYFPVWLRRYQFQYCVLVQVPITRSWVPWSGPEKSSLRCTF